MRTRFSIILTALVLFGCTNSRDNENTQIPEALEEETTEVRLFSKRGYGDLVDRLYTEEVNKSAELKKIEAQIKDIRQAKKDSLDEFEDFNENNNSYYTSALSKSGNISDSLLKQRIAEMISESKRNYSDKISELEKAVSALEGKSATLNDYHIALKIKITLPLIEKFQNSKLPAARPIKNLMNNYDKVIKRVDSVVSK
jgi:predicted RNase H-like nuclease (RuvC/YqgF family)